MPCTVTKYYINKRVEQVELNLLLTNRLPNYEKTKFTNG